MEILRDIVIDQFHLPVYYPANFERITIKGNDNTMALFSPKLISPKDDLDLSLLTKDGWHLCFALNHFLNVRS